MTRTSKEPLQISRICISTTKSGLDSPNAILKRLILSYSTNNILEYNSNADKTLDGTLHTSDQISYYRPQIQFGFNYNFVDEFASFIQLVNRPQFYIKYYDLELCIDVVRLMHLDAVDKSSITHYGQVFGIADISVVANSVLTYQSQDRDGIDIGYSELIRLAVDDERL
jgi:hypothetical protein